MSTRGVNIDINGNSRGATREIKKVGTAFKNMGDDARRAGQKAQGALGAGGRSRTRTGPPRRTRAAETLDAVSGVGGQVGSITGRASRALAAPTAGLAVAGTAAAAVAVTMNAVLAHMERAENKAGEIARLQTQRERSIKQATASANASALAATDTVRALAGLEGAGGVRLAGMLEKRGNLGAAEGLVSLSRSRGGLRGRDIRAAEAAAATGQLNFGAAAKTIAGGRVQTTGDMNKDAARIIAVATGHRFSPERVEAANKNLGGEFGHRLAGVQDARGGVTAAAQERLAFGDSFSLRAQLAQDAGDILNPTRAVTRELNRELAASVHELRSMQDAATGFAEFFREFKYIIGYGDGSFARQINNQHDKFAGAGVGP